MRTDLGGGVYREVLAYQKELMLVKVDFETRSTGSPHRHPHAQNTYVLSGEFEFCADGQKRAVKEGDSLCFAPGQEHSCLCLSKGSLLDAFSPAREDFL